MQQKATHAISCCRASLQRKRTHQVMNELKNAEASKAYKVKTETEEAQRIAEALKDKTVRITAKAGQGGRLFGSVTCKGDCAGD